MYFFKILSRMASAQQHYLRNAVCPSVTEALGLIVFFAHSWRCKKRTWFSEVMIFIVWHHQKAIPCLFGIRSPAGPPLWLILYSPRAPCLPACARSWILNSIWTQQCQSHFPSTCPLSWIAPASSVQSITLPFSDGLGVGLPPQRQMRSHSAPVICF